MASKPRTGSFVAGVVFLVIVALLTNDAGAAMARPSTGTFGDSPGSAIPPVSSASRFPQSITSTLLGIQNGSISDLIAAAVVAPTGPGLKASTSSSPQGRILLKADTSTESLVSVPLRPAKTSALAVPASPISPGATPLYPNVYVGFQGINVATGGSSPPDVQFAAGPSYVMEMVNVHGDIWTKSGSLVSSFSLSGFFGTGLDYIGDPKVLYDASSGRWFATISDISTGGFRLAVSASSDPSLSWWVWTFSAGACADQPILGLNDDKVIVSVNEFSTYGSSCGGSGLGATYWVLNKSNLVAGAAVWYYSYGPYSTQWSIHAVQSMSSTTTQYMVSSGYNSMSMYSITGVPPNAVTVTTQTLAISLNAGSPSAPQLGSSYLLSTGDTRVLDAQWYSGDLWLALDDGCVPAGDTAYRSCVHLTEIDTTSVSVLQDFDYGSAGMYYFYPALRTDAYGDVVMVFGYSSGSTYPGIMVTARVYDDAAGYLQAPWILHSGSGPEATYCPYPPVCRYGDYFGAAVDPSNTALVWVAGEYGTSSGWSTYIDEMRIEAAETLSYSISDGSTGYATPTLTYQFGGVYYSTPLTTYPVTYYVDAGSDWYFDGTLGGSTPYERWQTPWGYGYADYSSESLVIPYYHQYLETFVHAVAGGGTPTPWVSYTQYGWSHSWWADFSNWVDAGTTFSFQNPVPSGSTGERWYSPSPSGTATSSSTFVAVYYHQYQFSLSYAVVGGGSPSAPRLWGTSAGSSVSVLLGATPSSTWLDNGTVYSVTNPLAGSGGAERWQTNATTTGTVSAASTRSLSYYHQYLLGFGYSVVGGTSGSTPPLVRYTRFGVAASIQANESDWVDSGASYVYPSLLGGSNSTVRWAASGPTNGTATAPTVIVISYYHQYLVAFRYGVVGGGSGYSSPNVTRSQFGQTRSLVASESNWVDAGTAYAFAADLPGSTASERWHATQGESGTVSASGVFAPTYQHEFWVTIQLSPTSAGTSAPASGWYAAAVAVQVKVTVDYGWKLEGWVSSGMGSYTGLSSAAQLTVQGPITETAVLYAGLTISATDGGSVTYSYGNVSGSVAAGTSATIYAAPGTRVSLTEIPGFASGFLGWGGASSGGNATVSLAVEFPSTVVAEFGPDLVVIAGLAGGIAIAGTAVVLLALRKRKKRARGFSEELEKL